MMKKALTLLALFLTSGSIEAVYATCTFNKCKTPLAKGDLTIVISIDAQARGDYYIGHKACRDAYNRATPLQDRVFTVAKIVKASAYADGIEISQQIAANMAELRRKDRESAEKKRERETEASIQRGVESALSSMQPNHRNIQNLGSGETELSYYARCLQGGGSA